MIRKIDPNGRIVIPIELRNRLNWKAGDNIDMSINNSTIILQKSTNLCPICNKEESWFLLNDMDKGICKNCYEKIIKN